MTLRAGESNSRFGAFTLAEVVVLRGALLEVDVRARLDEEYADHPDSLVPKLGRELDAELDRRDGEPDRVA